MMAGNQTSVDYDQASSNSSEMATASAHADPAATTIDDVTVNQTTTTWSDHIEAVTCKDAYTRALEQLKACITATKADIDALKTNYDKAVTAFEQGDRDTAAEAEGLLRDWKSHRTPIAFSAPAPIPGEDPAGVCTAPSSSSPAPSASPSGAEPGTPTPSGAEPGTPTPSASPSGAEPGTPTPSASPSGAEPGTPTASPSGPRPTPSH